MKLRVVVLSILFLNGNLSVIFASEGDNRKNENKVLNTENISSKAEASPSATRFSLRANLLMWVVGAPSIGLSYDIDPRWQVSIDGAYGNWGVSSHRNSVNLNTAGISLVRYFRSSTRVSSPPVSDSSVSTPPDGHRARGAFLGIDLRYFNYHLLTSGIGYKGDAYNVGFIVGYSFSMGHPRWSLDIALGLGYTHRDYDHHIWYEPENRFRLIESRIRNIPGVTSFEATLAYRL